MSLKSFHIVFVICSVLFTSGFGYWSLQEYQVSGDDLTLVLCLSSVLAACGLLIYGIWFLKKLRGWSYL